MQASDLFTLSDEFPFAGHFSPDVPPWEWVKSIGPALNGFGFPATRDDLPAGIHCEGRVFVHPSVTLPHTCTLIGPAYIGAGTEIRPGAYIRGNVIVGENCVLGNACEFKNCLLLNGVEAPHFNYVGDSVLGNGAHLGAGAVLANLRLDRGQVTVRLSSGAVDTGLRKLGGLLGDGAEVGCNAVLQPGTVIGKRAVVLPGLAFGGVLTAASIARVRETTTTLPRKD